MREGGSEGGRAVRAVAVGTKNTRTQEYTLSTAQTVSGEGEGEEEEEE